MIHYCILIYKSIAFQHKADMSTGARRQDDREESLRQILSRRGSSLVSELLSIQRHIEPVEKAHKWAANPRCLLYRKSSPTSFRLIYNQNLNKDFVAISWAQKPSAYENPVWGKYSLISPRLRREERLNVRNVVFDRIVKYLEFAEIDIFWIDRICIDQNDEERKARAMNSMDLVYRNATKALGLLTTPIRTKKGLRLIELLLSGQLCREQKGSCYVFQGNIFYYDIIRLIQILHDLTNDPWWTRAWVFQEEYLSGLQMDLLIPIAPAVHRNSHPSFIPGELRVGACDLRKHATVFLLAYKNTSWVRYQASCDRILGIIGKYNILLPGPSNGLVCMSARILADIGKRDITEPWDVLAITANACGYDRRLDKDPLMRVKKSLSLCLLALLLLNGEVLRTSFDSDEASNDPLDVDIATCMKQMSLRDNSPHISARQLSFFKNCRLPSVQFCHRGVQTSGFLWELKCEHRIHTRSLRFSCELQRQDAAESEVWGAECLMMLALWLRRKHPSLASKLLKYIDNRRGSAVSLASQYMDRMGLHLERAIEQGHVLRIGYLEGGGAGAIFIPHRHDIFESMHAFTAWRPGNSEITKLDNFVSLKVDVKDSGALDVIDWMSGLAFFQGIEPEPVILDWPAPWKERL